MDLKGFKSLTHLDLTMNDFVKLTANAFSDLQQLHHLILPANRIAEVHEYAFNSTSIRTIHLIDTQIKFNDSNWKLFRHIQGIEKIFLGGFRDRNVVQFMFQNISSLKQLVLTGAGLSLHALSKAFTGLHNLEALYLISLRVKYPVKKDFFESLTSLKKLGLQNMRITVVNASTLPQFLWTNLSHIDFSGNPFDCSCKLFWFLNWIKYNQYRLVGYADSHNYACDGHLTSLKNVTLTPEECLARPFSPLIRGSLGMLLAILLIFVTASFVHRFRWYLRLLFFHLSIWLRPTLPKRPSRQDNFAFDLFVSHNSSDTLWVKDVLIPELEINTQPPFKLCVYSRNWIAGRYIDDCIIESLTRSRKTLLLVTNAFARSEWCQYEMAMAQHQLIQNDKDNLVLAVMEELLSENVSPKLRLLLKRKVYLQWTNDAVGQEFFWEQLKQMLRSDGDSVIDAMPTREEYCALL